MSLRKRSILTIVFPIITGLILLSISFILMIELVGLLAASILVSAGYNITILRKKKRNNSGVKIITDGEIRFLSNEGQFIFKEDSINELIVQVDLLSSNSYEGLLLLEDSNSEQHPVLSIYGQRKEFLEEDLLYLKRYIQLRLSSTPL